MKTTIHFLFLFLFLSTNVFANKEDSEIDIVINEMYVEIKTISDNYQRQYTGIHNEIKKLNQQLKMAFVLDEKISILIEKDELRDELIKLKDDEMKDLSKIRYLKGVQIIRLLYEKILSLDHHFASVRTFSEINKIGIPTNILNMRN